jgi:hypothetical protein
MRTIVWVWALSLPALGSAGEFEFASPVQQTQLVELYTSEGCSSCPPAESWIAGFRESSELWRQIVPVAFHVDYWDRLGWTDRFARPEFTARQRAYADAWGTATVYTPGFVINGQEWRGFFRNRALPAPPRRDVGVLKIASSSLNAPVRISFAPATPRASSTLRAFVAPLSFDETSDVARGENAGRKLSHDFLARHLEVTTLNRSDQGVFIGETVRSAPADRSGPIVGIAAWVTDPGDPTPLQATGGMVTSSR